jgi:hypothetical protein
MSAKIKCHEVRYRQGFVEVASAHPGCVNLEVWNVHPDVDIAESSSGLETIADAMVISNAEIELSASQARRLIELLQAAVSQAEEGDERAV